jgi:hypothetical protein
MSSADAKIPAVTSANLPKPAVAPNPTAKPSQAEAFVPDEQIIARPLIVPAAEQVKIKNRNCCYRWANRIAKEGESLRRWLAAGFTMAIPTVDVDVPAGLVRNGQIINGDLVLIKINRAAYIGALKYNEERAMARMAPGSVDKTARSTMNQALNDVNVPANLRGKVRTFVPSDAETEAVIKNAGQGEDLTQLNKEA